MSATPVILPAPRRTLAGGLRETDPVLLGAAAVCALLLVLAVAGPWLAGDPGRIELLDAKAGMSAAHPLGTDELGRDNLARLLAGARLSLLAPLVVVAAATAIGTTLALSAVWLGGAFEAAVRRLMNLLFAFPALLFALLAVAVFGEGIVAPVIALSIAYAPYLGRVVHGVAGRERALPYIAASGLAGLSGWRICVRHLLPNVRGMVAAQATIMFGSRSLDLAAISFIGLGVQPPPSEWGLMVGDGRSALLNGAPLECARGRPCDRAAVVAFNVLGDRLAVRRRRGDEREPAGDRASAARAAGRPPSDGAGDP